MPDPGLTGAGGRFGPEVYADWRRSSLGDIVETIEHRLILRQAGPLSGRSALDVGCGDGTLVRLFGQAGAARVAGCDADPSMIVKAGAAGGGAFAVARAQALPYLDCSFDIVSCITVLAFVPDVHRVVAEMARVVRPGGRLIIGDLGKWSLWAVRRRVRGWFGAKLWQSARFWSARELSALARDAGLSIRSVEGAIYFPPWTAAARWMAPIDPGLAKIATLGAAFIAVRADKA